MPDIIQQGTDCWIEANNIIDVRSGAQMDVTGFSVHAVARAIYDGGRFVHGKPNSSRRAYMYRMITPVVAEWSTSPSGTQGTATAGGSVIDRVQLHVTPAQTKSWRCPLVIVQAEMTDPITGYVARIIDELYEVNFEAVTVTQ